MLRHARIGAGQPGKFDLLVGTKAEAPAAEVVVHLGVAVLSVLSIALIERLLHVAGLDGRKVPAIEITLSDWMFYLKVVAAITVMSAGTIKAVLAALRAS